MTGDNPSRGADAEAARALRSAAGHAPRFSAAGLFVRERIVCGFKYARGTEVALRDWHHGLPRVVDEPKNFAVIAKRIQVARISGDLNNGPCHAIFLSAPCWCPSEYMVGKYLRRPGGSRAGLEAESTKKAGGGVLTIQSCQSP
jgi:hypothetical protein